MFTETAPEAVLAEVREHDFGADPVHGFGASRIDAIVALDRAISAAQAEQMAQIAALHAERVALTGVGRPDPTVSVIGEISMARKVGLLRRAPRSAPPWEWNGCLRSRRCSWPDNCPNQRSGWWSTNP